ncbi:MAG: DUF3836 domain-containing protein [Bacteroidaceae bacterium]|nr:DUF3836 domain-containing protein [Bacteroidaceae bacterium]
MKLIRTLFAATMLICMSLSANAAENSYSTEHRYEHDALGRITSRTTYVWNGEEWQPALRWTYSYSEQGYVVEYSRYDSRRHRFQKPMQRVVYSFTPDTAYANVSTYTLNDSMAEYELTDQFTAKYTPVRYYIAKNR